MASRSTMRSWLPAHRLGEDVLRLRDGSLRTVLECALPSAGPIALLSSLSMLQYRTQVVVQATRPLVSDQAPIIRRLEASHASLMSSLAGIEAGFLRRLLVVVSADIEGSAEIARLLSARVAEVHELLDREGLDPLRLSGKDLDAVAPLDPVQEGRCEVRVGSRLTRTLVVTRLPERLRADSLDATAAEHQISFHLQPACRQDLVELSAYVTLLAETRDALDIATERAEALLAADGVRIRRPYLQAEPALVSGMPLCLDLVGARRALTADQLRSSDAPSVRYDADRRLLYGLDPGTGQPLMFDRFALSNANGVVLGESPARSRVLALELARGRLAGRHVHVISPDPTYQAAIAALDGQPVAPTAFDALAVSGPEDGLESRVRALTGLIELMGGPLTPALAASVEDAIAFTYAAHGYRYETNDPGLAPPLLDEIRSALLRRGAHVSGASQAEIDALAGRLERYTAGAGRHLFGRRSTAPRLGPLSVHALAGLPPEDQPVAALLSLDRVWRSESGERPSLVVLDNAGRLLTGCAGQAVSRFMAIAPERRLGLTLATDDVAAVLRTPVRDAALNTGLTVLLRQSPAATDLLAEAYRLTPAEQSWLLRASPDEGLLIAQDRRLAFRAIASDEEEQLITGGTR